MTYCGLLVDRGMLESESMTLITVIGPGPGCREQKQEVHLRRRAYRLVCAQRGTFYRWREGPRPTWWEDG